MMSYKHLWLIKVLYGDSMGKKSYRVTSKLLKYDKNLMTRYSVHFLPMLYTPFYLEKKFFPLQF